MERTKRAHSLLVALLLSLLLGTGPAAAGRIGLPQVETSDAGKATQALRSLKRSAETPDDRDGPLVEPADPRIISLRPDIWPGNIPFAPAEIGRSTPSPHHYHARAPPASFVA